MNNAYVMSASFESRKNSQATMITAGFAGLMVLLMFLLKWTIPAIVEITEPEQMIVELNIPDEEEDLPKAGGGGGGGGNEVVAPGHAGTTAYVPPDPGTRDDARDVEDIPTEKTAPAVLKPDNPKPKAPKISENKAPVTPPKPVVQVPAPKPKHVYGGNANTGTSTGGNEATTYQTNGGTGTGHGVGTGPGGGGGTGGGTGGGRGSGVGPQVTKGDRSIVGSYSFEGDLDKATIYADVTVSPDGVGQFTQFARGSSSQSSAYRTAIIQYLQKMRFNKSDHQSTITVRFNFRVNG